MAAGLGMVKFSVQGQKAEPVFREVRGHIMNKLIREFQVGRYFLTLSRCGSLFPTEKW
jgi:hypothetical protein